jgi:hypothetical protein
MPPALHAIAVSQLLALEFMHFIVPKSLLASASLHACLLQGALSTNKRI